VGRLISFFRKAVLPLCWAPVIALYLYQFAMIRRCAVDVPYWDEWEYFAPGALPNGLTWQWLFTFHNEHRIVLTKLMAWLNMKFFGLDFALQQMFNFALFGCLLAALYFLMTKVTGDDRFSYFPLFMIFLLSPLNYQNHLWAFQSQFHLVLLFSVLALAAAFTERITLLSLSLFAMLVLLAMYSFSAGPVFSLVFLVCFMVYIAAARLHSHITGALALASLAIGGGCVGTGLVFWFHGYSKPPLHPEMVLPFTAKFWIFFLHLAGLGFGYTSPDADRGWIVGVICLVVAVLPVVLLLINSENRWTPGSWAVISGTAAVLAVLAAITMGRADLEALSEPRYNEFAFMLIPFAALAWWLALPRGHIRLVVMCLLWMLCFIGYSGKWSFGIYREVNFQRESALACIADYYEGAGNGSCQMSYDVPISGHIDQAVLLQAGFARRITGRDRNCPENRQN
jgi:hypothetical protein